MHAFCCLTHVTLTLASALPLPLILVAPDESPLHLDIDPFSSLPGTKPLAPTTRTRHQHGSASVIPWRRALLALRCIPYYDERAYMGCCRGFHWCREAGRPSRIDETKGRLYVGHHNEMRRHRYWSVSFY